MKYFDKLLQISSAFQPVLFAPKHALAGSRDCNWRKALFAKRRASGDFEESGSCLLSADEVARLETVVSTSQADLELRFHSMQLMTFLTKGAIHSVVHDADMVDTFISEAMLYSANMRLDKESADKLCQLAEDFAIQIQDVLRPEFGGNAAIDAADRALLKKAGLWNRP